MVSSLSHPSIPLSRQSGVKPHLTTIANAPCLPCLNLSCPLLFLVHFVFHLFSNISALIPFLTGDEFLILGFPCNQFGGQEPGTDDDIQSFCQVNYGVSFPIMGKTDVNGDHANPLFEWLKTEQPGLLGMKRVKWNFEKWLVGKDGKVKGRWASTTKPESLEKPILEELKSEKSEL